MKKIVRLTESDLIRLVKKVLNENVGDERRGIGNFLKTDDYKIKIKKLPNYLINIQDSAVNYWEETQDVFDYEKEELDKNKPLFSITDNVY